MKGQRNPHYRSIAGRWIIRAAALCGAPVSVYWRKPQDRSGGRAGALPQLARISGRDIRRHRLAEE